MAWGEFIAAVLVFFLSHSIPVRPRVRAVLVDILGPRVFTIVYSALSLAALVWVVGAAGRAPFLPLWTWHPWQNDVVLIAMGPVCILLALSIGRPNPFSFGGARNDSFDVHRPGLVRFIRHPLLLALSLWAFAHVVPNGDLAHVFLFGIFGSFALLGQRIIDRRRKNQMGPAWATMWDQIRATDWSAIRPDFLRAAPRLVGGAFLYGLLLWLHPWLFGVSPLS